MGPRASSRNQCILAILCIHNTLLGAQPLSPGLASISVIPGELNWQNDALRIFREACLLVVRGGVERHVTQLLLQRCQEASSMALQQTPSGNRDHGRFRFGKAVDSGSMLDRREWLALLESVALLDVLDLIFPEGGEVVTGGGDFVVAGCCEYQRLHSDVKVEGRLDVRWPPPFVSANVAVHAINAKNGPMRALPGTQVLFSTARREHLCLPSVDEEPPEWLDLTLQPLNPGDIIVRDVRVLHGGTPNHSDMIRHLLSLEIASSAVFESGCRDVWPVSRVVRCLDYEGLGARAQGWCWRLVEDSS